MRPERRFERRNGTGRLRYEAVLTQNQTRRRLAYCGSKMVLTMGSTLERLVGLVSRKATPSPLQCIEPIEELYGDKCVVLPSAKSSTEKARQFIYGRELLDLLNRLVTGFHSAL